LLQSAPDTAGAEKPVASASSSSNSNALDQLFGGGAGAE